MKPIKELVEDYKNTDPEEIFIWEDQDTNSEGWVVINSLRGGAAGGGTRMSEKVTKAEVTSLAKTMELKFTVAGPEIGGAKSGIHVDFDPDDESNAQKKTMVLERWYEAISHLLKTRYGTGGDMNVTDDEVIAYTKPYVEDPQEGILRGQSRENVTELISQLQKGVSLPLENSDYTPSPDGTYKINDVVTGYGVVESLNHYYRLFGADNDSLKGKKAIIQGWGNVGAPAGYFLAKNGARVVAISDGEGSVIKEEGFSVDEITELFKGYLVEPKKIAKHSDKKADHQASIFEVEADIFAPCAGSFVSQGDLDKLIVNGVQVIACGANVPFKDQGGGNIYSDIMSYADEKISVIPDFIANCGMAHTFAYLMLDGISVTEKGIFDSVSKTIFQALSEIKDESDGSGVKLTEKAIRIALRKIGHE